LIGTPLVDRPLVSAARGILPWRRWSSKNRFASHLLRGRTPKERKSIAPRKEDTWADRWRSIRFADGSHRSGSAANFRGAASRYQSLCFFTQAT